MLSTSPVHEVGQKPLSHLSVGLICPLGKLILDSLLPQPVPKKRSSMRA